ncbi:M1 family metallopeptidase [Lysobacter fragariae]
MKRASIAEAGRVVVAAMRVALPVSRRRPAARVLLVALLVAAPLQAAMPRAFDVVAYRAQVEPDLATRSIRGAVTVRLRTTAPTADIALDRGALVIDAVEEDGHALEFSDEGTRVRIRLPRTARAGERHRITLRYHGTPAYGLEFAPDRAQVYTVFSTSQWLPVVDAPDERATLDLAVLLPADLQAVGNGQALSPRRQGDARVLHRWRLRDSVPSYVYGFAAGRFNEAFGNAGNVRLRYLGEGFNAAELQRVFTDTRDMLAFFADKAGVPYAGTRYTQALVDNTVGQELAGFALLSEDYGHEVLADPQRSGLIAHEAAHQWWGNRVTCAGWEQFWLNEGVATFMAAAYLEHRFGRVIYDAQVERWRTRVERLRAEGKDKPLVFPDWNHPSGDDRAVVYQKGAYVLHLLRLRLGEDAFWAGLRDYTRTHIDRTVDTRDLQVAMQRHSPDDLAPFFAQWIYRR